MSTIPQLLFAAVQDGRWYWGLGDPDPGAVLVTGLYLLTSIICLVVAWQLRRNAMPVSASADRFAPSSGLRPPTPPASGEKGLEHSNPHQLASRHLLPQDRGRRRSGEFRFWLGLALLLFLLGVNKQGDFQSLLTLYGRDILRQAGLYEDRHTIQVVFIAGVAAVAIASVSLCLWIVRRLPWACRAAALGLALQAAFVVIRATSFHQVDRLIGLQLGNLKLNLLFESIGLTVVLLSAMFAWATERSRGQV